MKLTKQQLKEIIKEELSNVLNEGQWDDISGVKGVPGSATSSGGLGHRGSYRSGASLADEKDEIEKLGNRLRRDIKKRGEITYPSAADKSDQKSRREMRKELERLRKQADYDEQAAAPTRALEKYLGRKLSPSEIERLNSKAGDLEVGDKFDLEMLLRIAKEAGIT